MFEVGQAGCIQTELTRTLQIIPSEQLLLTRKTWLVKSSSLAGCFWAAEKILRRIKEFYSLRCPNL